MPRDYKHRVKSKAKKRPVSGWVWLIAGLLLGAFVASLAWLKSQSLDDPGGEWAGAKPDRPPQAAAAPARRVEVPPPTKPRFEFYDMLPEMEVGIPKGPIEEPRAPPRRERVDSDVRYVVQVGSFKQLADAEREKAQLALLGIEARVASAAIAPNDTRHRVQAGPYRQRAAVDRVRQRLAENGYKPIVIPLERR